MKLEEFQKVKEVIGKLQTSTVEAKDAYWINKVSGKIQKEIDNIEKQRVELIKKHGTKKGENITVEKKDFEKFKKEFTELL